MLSRLPLTIPVAAALTSAMFWVLWHLISLPVEVGELVEATRIEFTRMRADTETVTKREQKVERAPPPPVPELPRLSVASGSVDNDVVQLAPVVDTGAAIAQLKLTAGSDQDVIPLVRIAPDYPARALNRGIEGWVIVQFTITETGAVIDPVVVNSDPKEVFDEAALRAIARWRYNPRIEGGVAVERVGVQTIIRFQLHD